MAHNSLIDVVRNLIKDDHADPLKRIFPDSEISRMLKYYMVTQKKLKLINEDGFNVRYESFKQWWMDGTVSHLTADESAQVLFESVIYRSSSFVVVPTSEYVVDVAEGCVNFNSAQTDSIYATFRHSNVYHAGADLLEQLAAKKARTALGVQLGSLSVNLTKLPGELRAEAEALRAMGGPVFGQSNRSDRPPRRAHPSDWRL